MTPPRGAIIDIFRQSLNDNTLLGKARLSAGVQTLNTLQSFDVYSKNNTQGELFFKMTKSLDKNLQVTKT